MGYRSDVAIKCEDKAYKMIMDAAMAHDIKPDASFQIDKYTYFIEWEWVKWYYSYKDVAAIESVLDYLDSKMDIDENDFEGHSYTFARIGEDSEDTEIRTNCCNDIGLYITRSFDY